MATYLKDSLTCLGLKRRPTREKGASQTVDEALIPPSLTDQEVLEKYFPTPSTTWIHKRSNAKPTLVMDDEGRSKRWLQEQVAYFRERKLKKYDLGLTILECHENRDDWRQTECTSIAQLDAYLCSLPPPTLRTQLLFVSMNDDLPIRHFGERAKRDHASLLTSISATVLSLVGVKWDIPAQALSQICGHASVTPELKAANIKLPSLLEPPTAILNIRTVAVTCPPPEPRSDFELYVANLHCNPPRCDKITLFSAPESAGTVSYPQRCLAACSTTMVMKALVAKYVMSTDIQSVAQNMRYSLRYSKQVMAEQGCANLRSISKYLEQRNIEDKVKSFENRRHPSFWKLNYVVHLRDHLDFMKRLFAPLAAESQDLPEWPNAEQEQGSAGDKWLKKLKADFVYLAEAASELDTEAREWQKEIRTQIDSKSSHQTTLIAVLAAIYLPLSFATGVLGMNIEGLQGKPGPNGGPWESYSPKWWVFMALGLPLVIATILLPLGFDRLYRQVQEIAGGGLEQAKWIKWSLWSLLVTTIVVIIVVVQEVTKR